MKISEALILPCGATLPNRIAKSAMSENMADEKWANEVNQKAKNFLPYPQL